MQMKEVIISVTGIQKGQNGPDSTELVTPGQYGICADEAHMTWEESEITGMEGTKTSLDVRPGSVILSREGTINTRMEFEEGKKSYFLYETPYGAATLGLNTRKIRSKLGLHGGVMIIDYVIDMNEMIVGRNSFYIEVREPKESHIGDIRWPI